MSKQLFSFPVKVFAEKTDESADPTFTAVIANPQLTSYFTHLSSKVLRGFAATAKDGVMVLANHNRGQVVGRSTSGTFTREREVKSKFYVQRGLTLTGGSFGGGGYASTDDYIKAIQRGTYTDVSVGFSDYKEVCDYCGEEIKGSWLWSGDKNGHYPGQRIYVDKEGNEHDEPGAGRTEVLITAEVTEGTLFEYSLVDVGALPGAEVIKQAKLHKLDATALAHLKTLYGIDVNDPESIRDKSFQFVRPVTLLPDGKTYSLPQIATKEESKMATDVLESTEKALADAHASNATLTAQVQELTATVSRYEQSDDEGKKLVEANTELKSQVDKLTAENAQLSAMQEEYDIELARQRGIAKEMWVRMHGDNVDIEEFNKTVSDVKSIATLRRFARNWRISGDCRLGVNTGGGSPVYIPKVDTSAFDSEDYI